MDNGANRSRMPGRNPEAVRLIVEGVDEGTCLTSSIGCAGSVHAVLPKTLSCSAPRSIGTSLLRGSSLVFCTHVTSILRHAADFPDRGLLRWCYPTSGTSRQAGRRRFRLLAGLQAPVCYHPGQTSRLGKTRCGGDATLEPAEPRSDLSETATQVPQLSTLTDLGTSTP